MNNKIILLCGKSGCGKTTVANELFNQYGLTQVYSYTTRPRRYCSEQGHIFITKNEFSNITDMVATTYFDNSYYGATQSQVDENDIYVIDLNGIKELKENYTGEKQIVVIFLTVSENELIARMNKRGDTSKEIEKRILNDTIKFKGIESYADYIIQNNDLHEVVKSIYNIWNNKENNYV